MTNMMPSVLTIVVEHPYNNLLSPQLWNKEGSKEITKEMQIFRDQLPEINDYKRRVIEI